MTAGDPVVGLRRRHVIGLGVVATLVPLNSTMIAVALPDVASDLDVAKGSTGVLVTVYLVVMLVGQPTMGQISDAIGPRKALFSSLASFAVASLLTAFATTFVLLVIGRSVQAACGAAMMPASQALLRSGTPAHLRGRAFGTISSFIGIGAAGGPVVGGLVTELGGWRGVFVVNAPVVALAVVLLAGLAAPDASARVERHERPPLFAALRRPTFRAAFYVQAMVTLAQYSLLLVVPLVLDVRGWSSGEIGLALTGLTAGMVVMGPLGGRFGDHHGRRRPVAIGVWIGALSAGAAALVIGSSPAALIVAIVCFGVGTGFGIPSVMTAALESVPEEMAGSASGVLSMSRYAGSIPASLLLALLVADDGDGARLLLTIGTVGLVTAVAVTRALPGRWHT